MPAEVFTADPARLIIAAIIGLAVLLVLIIKAKFQPIIAILISACLWSCRNDCCRTLLWKLLR